MAQPIQMPAGTAPGMPGMPFGQPQQISPQQMQALQQRFIQEAQAQGLSPQEYAQRLQMAAQARAAQQAQAGQQGQPGQPGQPGQQQGGPQQQQAQQQGQPPQGMPIQQRIDQSQPPKPEALAVANFLKSQELKARPCVLQDKRRDLFKVKRAIRALQSPAYTKARTKNKLLPPITDRASAENVFKLLPISMLALRVVKLDPSTNPAHGQPGHQHNASGSSKKQKSAKKGGIWNVRIEPQQFTEDDMHYVWFYEGSQWKRNLYGLLALLAVVTVVLFPLWPYFLRRGVWYLSMGCLGLLGAFFGLAIVRLIIFIFTVAIGPQPGIWIFPNLFEDVGFFDSFKPTWAWRETKESMALKKAEKKKKKAEKNARREAKANGTAAVGSSPSKKGGPVAGAEAQSVESSEKSGDVQASGVESSGGSVEKRNLSARVEEFED